MKQAIRAEILSFRRRQNLPEKQRNDTTILRRLLDRQEFKKAKTIMLYLPVNGEVDLSKLFEQKLNKKLVLPRVSGGKQKKLLLYSVSDPSRQTGKGSQGIMEPLPGTPRIKKTDIDVVLVPGIAFARDGNRIGYGQGFYDRFLKNIRCPKIGIAYAFQIMKNVPGERHDQKVDVIVTEKEVIHCKDT